MTGSSGKEQPSAHSLELLTTPSLPRQPPLPRHTKSVTHLLSPFPGCPPISSNICIKLKFLSAAGVGKLFLVKAQVVNIFGFVSKEAQLGTLCGHLNDEGKEMFAHASVVAYKF